MGPNRKVVVMALLLLERALLRRVEGKLARTFGDGWPSLTGLPEPGRERRWLLRTLREHEALLAPVAGSRRAVEALLGGRRWPSEPPDPETATTLSAVIALLVLLVAPEADTVLALKAAWEKDEAERVKDAAAPCTG